MAILTLCNYCSTLCAESLYTAHKSLSSANVIENFCLVRYKIWFMTLAYSRYSKK